MATLSPSGLNIPVADKVLLKVVILTCGYLDQTQGLAFTRVLNMSSL